MERSDTRMMVDESMGATATSSWFWFGFTYFPPASLAGREARMS